MSERSFDSAASGAPDGKSYVDLGDGRFSYRRDQLWENGAGMTLGRLVEFRKGDPGSRAIVEEVTDETVTFQMLGRPVMDVTGGRLHVG